ncbi:hypothetical protein BO70DRAFT_287108 [Aspergillus heteromorphus CBS 117.55]|uniref:Uncharacterized protein n=1 Tax=Aspergillus heteromorphus CBS 117.55 TaxID=1448321 RepID=A0A317WU50_9EURO|nr:uncharacterized protein BO70DRAFT_287108 [Aspergillus heteromorphus CBS 117.55]PWY87770.1 hypothetical protein BO70DRAFT_287108 [Aspergillus heteromorphus CBS 117.55]
MSLFRSSHALRRCRLHPRPEFRPATSSSSSSSPPPHPLPKVQSFHTTPSSHAQPRRSPAARRAEYDKHYGKQTQRIQATETARPGQPAKRALPYTNEGIFAGRAVGEVDESLQWLDAAGPYCWKQIKVLSPDLDVSESVFMDVCRRLIQTAYTELPSAEAIRKLSLEPEQVWTMGVSLDLEDKTFKYWLTSSCALAGVSPALSLIAMTYLRQAKAMSTPPMRTRILERIETLALRDRDPCAMAVHSKVLAAREQYEDAMTMLDSFLTTIRPEKLQTVDNSNLENLIVPTLWEDYLALKAKVNERGGDSKLSRDELVEMAAVQFQNPQYLPLYAEIMLEKGDHKAYEESMQKAAMTGNKGACEKLANFYYLTSQAQLPRRGDKDFVSGAALGEKTGLFAELYSVAFKGVAPLSRYYRLALEWYELSADMGNASSAIILAMLYRRAGQAEKGAKHLEVPQKALFNRELLVEIQESWDNPDYVPEIPEELLSLTGRSKL